MPVAAQGHPASQHGTTTASAVAAWRRRRRSKTPCHQPCWNAQASSHLHATHQLSIPGCHIHHYRAPDQMAPAQQLTPALGSMRCRSGSDIKLAAASLHAATAEVVLCHAGVQDGPELPLALQGMCNSGGGQVGGSREAWVWHDSTAGSRGSRLRLDLQSGFLT